MAHVINHFNGVDPRWVMLSVLIFLLILSIVQLIACFRFNSMRHTVLFEKRYPRLVLIEAVMVLVSLLFVDPILAKSHFAPNWSINISPFVTDLICWPITYLCFMLESGRLWLMAFDLHHLHHSQNQKWRTLIDGSESNWFLRNKKTFGNAKNVQIAMAFFYFLPMLVQVILHFAIESDAQMYGLRQRANQFVILLNEFFVFSLAFKCRKLTEIKDNLYFHWEIKTTAKIWLLGAALFAILVPVESIAARFDELSLVVAIVYTVRMVAGILMLVLPSLVSTLRVPHKMYKSVLWECDNGANIVKGHRATDYPHTVESIPESTTLDDMFQCGERWEKLMTWMFKEFNHELGLFLIEIIQFKHYMVHHLLKDEDVDVDYSMPSINSNTISSNQVPLNKYQRYLQCSNESMPRSEIIRKTDESTTLDEMAKCRAIAQLIFDKYIDVNAEFMLNLTGVTRSKFTRLSESNWPIPSNEEFVLLFDPMIKKMIKLSKASFSRYSTFHNNNPRPPK